jgi:hypothetical protein
MYAYPHGSNETEAVRCNCHALRSYVTAVRREGEA